MSCPWSHHSTCRKVWNMVHGAVEHGEFWGSFVLWQEQDGGRLGRWPGAPNYISDFCPAKSTLPTPLRAPTWVTIMKPTIRMARHDPTGQKIVRWG